MFTYYTFENEFHLAASMTNAKGVKGHIEFEL